MTPATDEQEAAIDARRQPGCRHPSAGDFLRLEYLACKRCGVVFVDGKLELSEPVPTDPPGFTYLSSYAGQLYEDDDP